MSTWNASSAKHLLSRCLFGYTSRDVTSALSHTLNDYVENVLLAPVDVHPPPGNWVNEEPDIMDPNIRTKQSELLYWWLQQFYKSSSLQEKMVLFWHNHFVSEMAKFEFPQFMYWQNHLFRSHAFGNFKTLTKAVTIDAAMLYYLDGVSNSKASPNENYARELLELFTLGIGNYSDKDVKEAARALTGWQVKKLTSYFNPDRFDNTNKTFLGETQNFNHETLVDTIFRNPKTAEYICTKVYKEFICHTPPDSAFIKQMATVLLQSDYEMRPLLAFMLKSDHFYDTRFRGCKIKSPVDLLVGTLKAFEISTHEYSYLQDMLTQLQQSLFNPPNVKGWEGQRKWISSATYPLRHALTDSFVNGKTMNGQGIKLKIDGLSYARTYSSCEDASEFVNDVVKHHILYPLSESKKNFLLETLLEGAIPADWSTYSPMAETRIINLLKALMRLPEYQLC